MGNQMVFVVGARRSGTLWVQRILSAHPRVSPVPTETYLFSYGISQVFERLQHGLISSPRVASVYADREAVVAATRKLCDTIFLPFADTDDSLVVERTPWHAHHLELIAEVYPEARILHVIRDGRDVARSLAAQPWGPETVAEAAAEWVRTLTAGREGGQSNHNYREVRYEALLDDPVAGATELYAWLGLESSGAVFEASREAAEEQQNLGADASVAVAKWKREWERSDLEAFEAAAGPLLDELGYPREDLPRRRQGSLRALRRRGEEPGPVEPAPQPETLDHEPLRPQKLVEDVVAALRPGSGELRELLEPGARIRIIDGTETTLLHGERGLERLERELAADPAFAGRQILGESFPAVPTTTVILAFELPDGARASRTLLLRPSGGGIAELTLIRPATNQPGLDSSVRGTPL